MRTANPPRCLPCLLLIALLLCGTRAAAQKPVIYVDYRNAEAVFRDGLSWATAVTTIRQGLRRAELLGEAAEVWVAAGTYAEIVFLLDHVEVYAGFLGTEQRRGQRDFARNITIIEADGANDGATAETLVFGADGAVLDGFIVRGARGVYGGGMVNDGVSPLVRNCIFDDNSVTGSGGAILNNGNAFPVIERCRFLGNFAGLGGGAIANNGAAPEIRDCTFQGNVTDGAGGAIANTAGASALVTRCLFQDNMALAGGAIHTEAASPTIDASIFEGNRADSFGGALHNDGARPLLVNGLFFDNVSGAGGGAVSNLDSPAVIINCTFTRNEAREGGAVFNNASDARAVNSIFWDNAPGTVTNVDSRFTVRYSAVQDGHRGTGNFRANPQFRDPAGNDFRLGPDSPCIDRGIAQDAPSVDLDGVSRPQGDGIDMGAYEAVEIGNPASPGLAGCIAPVKQSGMPARHGGDGLVLGVAVLAGLAMRWRK